VYRHKRVRCGSSMAAAEGTGGLRRIGDRGDSRRRTLGRADDLESHGAGRSPGSDATGCDRLAFCNVFRWRGRIPPDASREPGAAHTARRGRGEAWPLGLAPYDMSIAAGSTRKEAREQGVSRLARSGASRPRSSRMRTVAHAPLSWSSRTFWKWSPLYQWKAVPQTKRAACGSPSTMLARSTMRSRLWSQMSNAT
jgi:hypothetical protein